MQGYMHTFRAGTAGYTEPTTVLFYTQDRRATKGAAERIARALRGHVGMPLAEGDVEFIKGRLTRLDRVEEPDQYGLVGYAGRNCGGAVRVAVRAD